MAYIYFIHRPNDTNVGYIGQARNNVEALHRIYQHIAAAYGLPVDFTDFLGELRWGKKTLTDDKTLKNNIAQLGACNMSIEINANENNCYGANIEAFKKFRLTGPLKGYSPNGRGRGGLNPTQCMYLDFAEIIYINKFLNAPAQSEPGGQGKFTYNNNKLTKILNKVSAKSPTYKNTLDVLVQAINNTEFTGTAQHAGGFQSLKNPEAYVIQNALTTVELLFPCNIESFHTLGVKLAENKGVRYTIEEIKTALGHKQAQYTITCSDNFLIDKNLATKLQKDLHRSLKTHITNFITNLNNILADSKLNISFKLANEKAVTTTATQLYNQIISQENNPETKITLSGHFTKDTLAINKNPNYEPEGYTLASSMLNGFTPATNTYEIFIDHLTNIYNNFVRGAGDDKDTFKALFRNNPSFVMTRGDKTYYDELISSICYHKGGPLVFAPGPFGQLAFSRQNLVDNDGSEKVFSAATSTFKTTQYLGRGEHGITLGITDIKNKNAMIQADTGRMKEG